MTRSGRTQVSWAILVGGACTVAATSLPAQQRNVSEALSRQPVLNLQLAKDAQRAFQMHGKMDIPLNFDIEGATRATPQLQLLVVNIRNGRVNGIGRSKPFSPPGSSLESSIGGRTATCCIDWCRGDGEGNWEYSRTCGHPCASEGVGLLSPPVADLPAVQSSRILPREGDDFSRFAAKQFDRPVKVRDAVLLGLVPADARAAKDFVTKPLLLEVKTQ